MLESALFQPPPSWRPAHPVTRMNPTITLDPKVPDDDAVCQAAQDDFLAEGGALMAPAAARSLNARVDEPNAGDSRGPPAPPAAETVGAVRRFRRGRWTITMLHR